MKNGILAAAGLLLLLSPIPTLAVAQVNLKPPAEDSISQQGLRAQLDRLGARIDRDRARGRLTAAQADEAHAVINNIDAAAATDRENDGGHLSLADHFDILSRIDRLKAEVRREAIAGGAPSGH